MRVILDVPKFGCEPGAYDVTKIGDDYIEFGDGARITVRDVVFEQGFFIEMTHEEQMRVINNYLDDVFNIINCVFRKSYVFPVRLDPYDVSFEEHDGRMVFATTDVQAAEKVFRLSRGYATAVPIPFVYSQDLVDHKNSLKRYERHYNTSWTRETI